MKFECMQCGGNMLYSLEARKMVCPNCGGEDCYEININGYFYGFEPIKPYCG